MKRAPGRWLLAGLVGVLAAGFPGRADDAAKGEEGFTPLFNGKDLTGWRFGKADLEGKKETPNKRFSVKGGAIAVEGGGGDLHTVKTFPKDFHLKVEFRAAPRADSGLFIRGPQLQVRDYPTVGPYTKLKKFKKGDWNELDVVVKGRKALCKCNGEVIEKAFPVPADGPIGLQSEGGRFEFRRIRIKETE